MVGIVIVSHSATLAEGVAELARGVGEAGARVEVAGGLDEPGALGTDAARVVAAIERADEGDGVVVLMDLGSAVLSAELALDFLPPELRERVVLSEAPLVEGAVAAAVTAGLGATLDAVSAEARGGLAAKAAHLGAPAPGAEASAPLAGVATDSAAVEAKLTVTNEHGLHARPAARFVATAGRFEAETTVTNLRSGVGPASARSLNSVATLGVRQGDEILVTARGADAVDAVAALRELVEHGLDGARSPQPEVAPAPPASAPPAGALQGLPAAPGIAVGPARHLQRAVPEVPTARADDPASERAALAEAIAAAVRDVDEARATTLARAGPEEAAIFEAHLLLLEDESLVAPAERAIDSGENAALAWRDAVDELARRYDQLEDEYQRARAADLRAVGDRVLAALTGAPAAPSLAGPGIVVAADLSPAETAALEPGVAQAIATAHGSPTSHAAILARSLALPAVVALGQSVLDLAEGTQLALDGDAGVVVVDPPADVVQEYEARAERIEDERRVARARAHEPAVTRDGTTVEVAANVGAEADLRAVVEGGADGVGLLRTEFLFLDRDEAPSEEEQEGVYRRIAAGLGGKPVILRTLDAGADKPLRFLREPPELNPFLGVRGLRLSLTRPELFRAQLRAAVRVAAELPLKVMFPMVSTVAELRAAVALLPAEVEKGIMVEVPATALNAAAFAPHVAFFSLGTNDLTQYTLAADRGNERVAPLADGLDPGVLRLVASVTAAAEAHGKWVGVCGELAGDPVAVPILLGLGVRELSVSPPLVPGIKDRVRTVDIGEAAALAWRALELDSAAAVRALVSE